MTNPDAVTILAFLGSLRRGSHNRRLLEAARGVAPAGIAVEIGDLRPFPFYDSAVETAGDSPAVRDFKARIRAADALLIARPEDNGTIPSLLQNAIDRASRPRGAALAGKRVAILGGSPGGGTARARRSLRQVLANAGAAVLPAPELLVPRVANRFDAAGALRDDGLAEELRELLAALVGWAGHRRADERHAA